MKWAVEYLSKWFPRAPSSDVLKVGTLGHWVLHVHNDAAFMFCIPGLWVRACSSHAREQLVVELPVNGWGLVTCYKKSLED
jgi:hypothetical protein